jgi:hypothetical protein
VLVRSGQTVALVSRRFVRQWSAPNESVLFRNEPELPPSERGNYAAPVAGGISDDPHVAVAVFHHANLPDEAIHPAVLRLDPQARIARFDALDKNGRLGRAERDRLPMSSALRLQVHLRRFPQLGSIAWLEDTLYVVARGREEQSPSYAVFASYHAPWGQLAPILDLGEYCATRVSSSRRNLLVTYTERAGQPSQVFNLARPAHTGIPVALPAGAVLLDHEADGFWYLECDATSARYVFAQPTE